MADMWTKLKTGLVVAGGAVVAITLLLLSILGLGRKLERAESLEEGIKQNDEFQDRIRDGHVAGNLPVADGVYDPNDRANQRKSREGSLRSVDSGKLRL